MIVENNVLNLLLNMHMENLKKHTITWKLYKPHGHFTR